MIVPRAGRDVLLLFTFVAALAACGKVEPPLVDTQMAPQQVTLSISHSGAGKGTVTSAPAGIDCGAACSISVASGTQVTLTAASDATSTFTGWNGGGCTGSGPCTITVTSDQSVDASFAKMQVDVTLSATGNGSGTVVSAPAGIDCGAACAAKFDAGTAITLTATAAATSTFVGWTGGGCTGTAPCTFTPTADTTVQASFAADDSLVITRAGNGGGTVTSTDGFIACGSNCSHQYAPATKVTLTASANAQSNFVGWSGGGCTGTGTCQVTITSATLVTATFALKQFTLTAAKSGAGAGTITSADGDIACGTTCSHAYDDGTVVTLTAAPGTGSTFAGWSGGGCTGTGPCQVTVTAATTVTATFALQQETLSVTTNGNGTGTVTSAPVGIACGATCSASFSYGTAVTLAAAPASDSDFAGWGGACSGTGTCVVTLSAASDVTATFTKKQYTLTAAKSGAGTGTIASSDGAIACGTACSHAYDVGTVVTLTATASTGSTFAGWSGACTGTGTCQVTMNAAASVTATFTLQQITLTVGTAGNGAGTVTSSPAGISCGATCSSKFAYGTVVTLTAAPSGVSTFAGWSGACTGTGSCQVTMNAVASVTATFTLPQETLTVATVGSGSGAVTSAPAGISCGGNCSASFAYGTVVTLTASPAFGSTFSGWSGACSGTGGCVVTVDSATSVTAQFTLNQYTLTAGHAGSGSVSSTDGAIGCGEICSATYDYGTVVTLTASASFGSTFTGWSGACSGTGNCVVTITGDTNVTANFTANQYTLTVTNSSSLGGSGTITSSVGGINCGNACSATLAYGTFVTLTPMPSAGSSFAGWSGACSGTGSCSFGITGNTTVGASFTCQAVTFSYTGAAQTYTVPACATRVHVEAWGAQGATGQGSVGGASSLGGLGGYAKGDLAVTPGQVLTAMVGGQSGWNGGGAGVDDVTPGNGGDASDVRFGGTSLGNRIVIAGGGGGGIHSAEGNYVGGAGGGGTCGTSYCGGAGGLGNGGNGGNGSTAGGVGVTATDAGGAGGGGTDAGGGTSCETRYSASGICGTRGTFGLGGNGDATSKTDAPNCYSFYGGTAGGGGGDYGGGGSSIGNCGGGGGGGGSSVVSTTLTSIVLTGGQRAGTGQVTITPF